MFYVRLFGAIFILIATFFNGLFLILFTGNETTFDITLILGIVGLVIAFIALLILNHEESKVIKKYYEKVSTPETFRTSEEGKKWDKRRTTIIMLGVLWFFSSFAMIFVAMALQKKFGLY